MSQELKQYNQIVYKKKFFLTSEDWGQSMLVI